MLNIMNNNKIKKALISCIAACKKAPHKRAVVAVAMVMAIAIYVFSLLPLTVRAAGADQVELLVKVNREVVRLPDLYEHLTLTLETAYNAQGVGAVEVLNTRMNQLSRDPISLGEYDLGRDIWVFFKIVFDGHETGNEYQGSKVNTSYDFISKSNMKLNVFKILGKKGNVFENMTNLNPGDVKEGVVHIDPMTLKPTEYTTGENPTTSTPTKPTTEERPTTSAPTKPTTGERPATSTPTKPTTGERPATSYPIIEEATGDGKLPVTNDPTPIKPLIYLSAGLAAFLCVQVIIYVKRKRKDKTEEPSI